MPSVSQDQLAADAAVVREQARSGRSGRGEQDAMLRLEAQVPGFGGYYLDENGNFVILSKDLDSAVVQEIRRAVELDLLSRSTEAERGLAARMSKARARQARFALSELVVFQNRISYRRSGRIDGLVSVGVSVPLNALTVDVVGAAAASAARELIVSLGVDADALQITVLAARPEFSVVRFYDYIRPVRGGLRIAVPWADVDYACSAGFAVRRTAPIPLQVDFALTASHCFTVPFGRINVVGDSVYQPTMPQYFASTAAVSPWQVGAQCPIANDGQPAEFCGMSDVAALGSSQVDRRVGVSRSEGVNGAWGSQEINNWFPIQGTLQPEFVIGGRNVVHKSGWTSGTTTGAIESTNTNVQIRIRRWGNAIVDWDFVLIGAVKVTGIGIA